MHLSRLIKDYWLRYMKDLKSLVDKKVTVWLQETGNTVHAFNGRFMINVWPFFAN